MSIVIKVALCACAFLLVVGSICVTIAALYPPKEYKGDEKTAKSDCRDQSI